jgi:hypothetical protein
VASTCGMRESLRALSAQPQIIGLLPIDPPQTRPCAVHRPQPRRNEQRKKRSRGPRSIRAPKALRGGRAFHSEAERELGVPEGVPQNAPE